MSNSHPCQGQRMISPSFVYSISPGVADCASPISGPSQSEAPWCGQRFKRPKYLPLMLNTAIGRPSISRNFRVPGGSSPTAATTCRAILDEPINFLGVVEIKRLLVLVADAGGQHARRLVVIPMGVVGREQ